MRPLVAGHFDRMADFHGVKPVRNKRVSGESRQIGRPLDLEPVRGPTGRCADQEGGHGGGNGRQRAIASAGQPIEIEPCRRGLIFEVAVALAKKLGLLAPGGNALGVIGMCSQPCLDDAAPVGGQLVIDIGVELFFAQMISVAHCLSHRLLHAA